MSVVNSALDGLNFTVDRVGSNEHLIEWPYETVKIHVHV